MPPPAEMTAAEYRVWALTQLREREWQAWIVREARQQGWETYHTRDSRGSDPGFPDLVLACPVRGVRYIECKTEKGRVRPEQRRWLAILQASGQRAFVARPRDVDAVERLLAGETVWIGPRFAVEC
jgi:hypothetical protein